MAQPLREELFFAASLKENVIFLEGKKLLEFSDLFQKLIFVYIYSHEEKLKNFLMSIKA